MDTAERELVRQTLFIVDADVIRASNRVRAAMQIIRDAPMSFDHRKEATTKLEEANEILLAISKCKEELYKLLDEQAHANFKLRKR